MTKLFLFLALAVSVLSAQQVVAPSQISTVSGNGATLVTTTGAQTSGNCVTIDSHGNHVASGSGCSSGGSSLAATFSPDVPPTVAGAIDDEFNGASLTGWTQVNQGTSTTAVANGVLSILPQISNGAHRLYAITKAEPVTGGPWTVTAKLNVQDTVVVNTYVGLCVYDGTKLSTIELTNLGGTLSIGWTHWTNVTTPSVTTVRTIGGNWSTGWVWLQINNDGTNLNFNVSSDGRLYNQIHTETKANFVANTGSVGIYGNVTATGGTWTLDADYIRSTP